MFIKDSKRKGSYKGIFQPLGTLSIGIFKFLALPSHNSQGEKMLFPLLSC